MNFALPDLRGRAPIHVGNAHTLGERSGEAAHTLSIAEMPEHSHVVNASGTAGNVPVPSNNILAPSASQLYSSPTSLVSLNPASVSPVGGSQAHLNMQPFLTVNFCIALEGIFPSPN